MAFSNITQYKAAFKLLFGKAHTANAKDLVNEAKAAAVSLGASQIFGEAISSTPSQAVLDGVAEHVVCDLSLDSTSNGLSYQAVYPTGHSLVGQNVLGIIPQSFGDGYRAILRTNGSTEVTPLDARNWFLTPSAGVVTSESALSLVSGTLDCYVYVGDSVQTRLDGIGTSTEALTMGVAVSDRQVVFVQGSDVIGLGSNASAAVLGKRIGIAAATTGSSLEGPVYMKQGTEVTFPAGTFTGLLDSDIFVSATPGSWEDDISGFSAGNEVIRLGKVKTAEILILDPAHIIQW